MLLKRFYSLKLEKIKGAFNSRASDLHEEQTMFP